MYKLQTVKTILLFYFNVIRSLRFRSSGKSVLVFSVHKAASTFFSREVLPYIHPGNLRNYAGLFFQGVERKINFRSRGYVYGPIRTTVDVGEVIYSKYLLPAYDLRDNSNFRKIIIVRDPRDVLISGYYSFGFSHRLSSSSRMRAKQMNNRDKIIKSSIDEYCLENIESTLHGYNLLMDICSSGADLIRYEDMISDFAKVEVVLKKYNFPENRLRKIKNDARPSESVDVTKHKRSGKSAQYKQELAPATIIHLNERFEKILSYFDYEIL